MLFLRYKDLYDVCYDLLMWDALILETLLKEYRIKHITYHTSIIRTHVTTISYKCKYRAQMITRIFFEKPT